jgi:hypothetical protein
MENLEQSVSAPAATEQTTTPTETFNTSTLQGAIDAAMNEFSESDSPSEQAQNEPSQDAPATETPNEQSPAETEPLTAPPLTDEGTAQDAEPAQSFIPKELQELAKTDPALAPAIARVEQTVAKMHEGFTTFRKMQQAFATKEGAAQVIKEIQDAYAQAYGEPAETNSDELTGYYGEEDVAKLVSSRVQAELERLGVTKFVKEQQQLKAKESQEAQIKAYIADKAVPLAPQISKRLEGFPVDAGLIEKAVRESPELWTKDPVAAVQVAAGDSYRKFLKGTPPTMPPSGGSQVKAFDTTTAAGAVEAALRMLDS